MWGEEIKTAYGDLKRTAVIGNFAKRAVEGAEPFSRQEGGIWRCACDTRAHVLPCGRTGGSGGELWAHCVLRGVQFSVLKGVCCHCCQIKYNIYNYCCPINAKSRFEPIAVQ